VFVEYVLDRNASYALEVSRLGMLVHSLPSAEQITKLTKAYLTKVNAGKDERLEARALYSALIAPIAAREWNSLIIVPDGSLHLIPFGALLDSAGTYLIQRGSICIAPSASVLATLMREPEIRRAKPFLGIAFSEAVTDSATVAKTRGIADIRGGDIKPLQYSREEVDEANQALGGNGVILQGMSASETALKSEPLSEFRIIHIAAHSVGDEIEPDRAAIVLHPGNSVEDGLWQAREIRHTRLNADVVVLSACETGSGRLQGEEGIMNLARAFLTAGTKSVVASLWDVDDRSTATLMEDFYQHLAKGESIALALRSCQLEFIKTYGEKARPHLWAGFEVIGDGTRTIVTTSQHTELQAARAHIQ
jgi:CHAT domain-containing protein